jgi:aspartyl-tRNA(Asn)/glutamyl-tRNA(Gln) amidotransferase subunit B
MGLPGTLPVINRLAVEAVIKTGLALNSEIAEHTKFDRKNYPYPDLMKGYQISQYDLPICIGGQLDIEVGGISKRIGITRVHLEEDVAKLFHRTDEATGEHYSLLDINRSGVPLMETVSEPDMRSPEEARQYLIKLRAILQYLGVSTGSMEEGSFRCDANVSIRPKGETSLGKRTEIKNMNSLRAVFRAIEFEVQRQTELVESARPIEQETRGWSEERGVTYSMRSKEEAHDYRYFPEPDLPPLTIDRAWTEQLAERLPELPDAKKLRFVEHYGLSDYNATMLTISLQPADFFENSFREYLHSYGLDTDNGTLAKSVANWTMTELGRVVNATGTELEDSHLTPQHVADLLHLLHEEVIGTSQAKTTFDAMFTTGESAQAVVDAMGLTQITDTKAINTAVSTTIGDNPKAVEDFMRGKDTAVKFLVGQVMKVTKGKANPTVAAAIVKEQLERMRT